MSQSAYLVGISKIKLDESRPEELDGLKLKVDSCAICGSDIRIFNKGNERVKYPAVIGHEIAGTVVETNVDEFSTGDRVSIGADIPCGKCSFCNSGKPNLCKENLGIGYQLNGGFSDYIYLSKQLIKHGPIRKLPPYIDFEIGCLGEPLACAINGLEKLHMRGPAKLIIFGAGPIGIMLGMLAKKYYMIEQVDYIEPSKNRIKLLQKLDIADNIFNPEYIDNNISNFKNSYQYVITACSAINTHILGIELLANGGSINFFGGLPKPAPSIPIITNEIHYKELTLTGSHGSTPAQHKRAIEIIGEQPSFFKQLITHRFKLSDINQAFEVASRGDCIKILIKP